MAMAFAPSPRTLTILGWALLLGSTCAAPIRIHNTALLLSAEHPRLRIHSTASLLSAEPPKGSDVHSRAAAAAEVSQQGASDADGEEPQELLATYAAQTFAAPHEQQCCAWTEGADNPDPNTRDCGMTDDSSPPCSRCGSGGCDLRVAGCGCLLHTVSTLFLSF